MTKGAGNYCCDYEVIELRTHKLFEWGTETVASDVTVAFKSSNSLILLITFPDFIRYAHMNSANKSQQNI